MKDLGTFLSFEIKKEIADRYFGFRKAIENDTGNYHEKVQQCSRYFSNNTGTLLGRVFSLLVDDDLINAFIQLTELPERKILESYLTTSSWTKATLFKDVPLRGMTKKSSFKNLFFDTYKSLHTSVQCYRATFSSLTEEQETIGQQISIFYKKNDISTILQFLNGLETTPQSHFCLLPDNTKNFTKGLDNKMQLSPPPPPKDLMLDIPSLPPFKGVRADLKKLAGIALTRRPAYTLTSSPT